MIEQLRPTTANALGFKLSGKLHDEDYKVLVPAVDAAIAAHGPARLLVWLDDFEGWDLHALWDDAKFGVTHFNKVERIAIVGDKTWEEWMAKLARLFTLATVKYFDEAAIDAAWEWVGADG